MILHAALQNIIRSAVAALSYYAECSGLHRDIAEEVNGPKAVSVRRPARHVSYTQKEETE